MLTNVNGKMKSFDEYYEKNIKGSDDNFSEVATAKKAFDKYKSKNNINNNTNNQNKKDFGKNVGQKNFDKNNRNEKNKTHVESEKNDKKNNVEGASTDNKNANTNVNTNANKNANKNENLNTNSKSWHKNYDNKKINPASKIKIIPIGGLSAIGMNMTLIEDGNDIVVIDCGNAFPSEDLLGVDLVIPDISYLKKNRSKIRGMVLTHGHEDHIGAIPYILKDINMPIYGTRLTLALVEEKLKEHKITGTSLNVEKFGDVVTLGKIKVEFIKTNHSIVDSAALAIYTSAGTVMHTGDFKIDYTPVFGDTIDLSRIAEIGKSGVLALLSDSTNAIKPGFTMSERVVGKTFDAIFNEHEKERIIVSSFASNVDRVRQVIDTASRYGRKVAIEGRSMINIINIATELGYIDIPKGTLIQQDMLKNYKDSKTVIVTTGSQGESMAALSRMAQGTNKKVNIKPDDLVILSSSPIPGNEKAVNRIIDELYRRHAKVIFQDTHVSGHACQEELKLIYTLVNPTYAIPVHGEYRHRKEAANVAESVGVSKDKCLLLEVGDVLQINSDSAKVIDHVASNGINVDGLGVGDVGSIVLKDRQVLANSGVVIIAIALSHSNSDIVSGPDIISKGFVYMKDSEDLINELKKVVRDVIDEFRKDSSNDWKKLKSMIINTTGTYLWKTLKREPLVIPVIIGI